MIENVHTYKWFYMHKFNRWNEKYIYQSIFVTFYNIKPAFGVKTSHINNHTLQTNISPSSGIFGVQYKKILFFLNDLTNLFTFLYSKI